MASRLIERLDQAIARAETPLQRECLKAERAGALARHGQMSEARFALTGVRTQSQRLKSPQLTAWVHLVDGLIDHFESIAPQAQEKFLKAHEQARLAGDQPMQALAAGWMATVSFNASDLPAMKRWLREALALAPPDHHSAWARVGLVLADAYRFAGDDERSQVWYLKAREHANADGDASMMSALLHNISAMRSARIGLEDAFGRASLEEAGRAMLEAESTANYDWGARAAALAAMVPVIRAQLLVVLGRYAEATALFDAHLARARSEGMAHRESRFLADRAWCHVRERRIGDALRDAQQAEIAVARQLDDDDRAATHARLARVYAACDRPIDAGRNEALAEAALQAHEAGQSEMLAVLNEALTPAA